MSDLKSIPIIRSKLYMPRHTQNLIIRDLLLKSCPIGNGGEATLVCAPAGYGKSTFVAQGISVSGFPCAWFSLDPEDNDIRRFLTYLIASLRSVFPNSCTDTAKHLQMLTLPLTEILTGVFCNDLDQLDNAVTLVLDDYHHISSTAIHDLVSAILRRPPRNVHIVIVTRCDPPLSLHSLRASGTLTEVRMQHLAFTEGESHHLIRSGLGNVISERAIMRLHLRTEGWPVALHLAMLAVPKGGSVDDFVDSIPCDNHSTREYLLHEVLASSAAPVRNYLLRTSFLDRYCASLCEAVLSDKAESNKDNDAVMSGDHFMNHIRESGLFSIALDNQRKWFRYHHLFQSMLQDQALSVLGADAIRDIYVRASNWSEAHGLLEDAIQHLVRADRLADAAAFIVRHRNTIMNTEQWHRLDGWFRLLPPELIASTPELLLLKARYLITRGSREESWPLLEKAVSLLETTTMDKDMQQELYGSLESTQCLQLYVNSDGQGALESARRALKLLPSDSYAERGYAMIIVGGALQMTGDIELARKTLYAALSGGDGGVTSNDTYNSRVLIALCFVFWMQADLQPLAMAADEAHTLASSGDLNEALSVATVFQATCLYHRNKLTSVSNCLAEIVNSQTISSIEYYSQSLIIASLTQQELGNASAASELARSLQAFALNTRSTFIVTQSEAFTAEIALRQSRISEALNWAKQFDPEPFTPIYYFYSPIMTLAKVLVMEDGEQSRQRASKLLNKHINYLSLINNRRFMIEALALRAILLAATGNDKASLDDLTTAITMAQPGRFIRLFVDLGPRFGILLNRLDLDDESLIYAGKILAAFHQGKAEPTTSISHASIPALKTGVEPLSKRELQILTLLMEQPSNKLIADYLHISVVTVKRHTANIYQKLGVHNRRQAVAKATGLGMLPPRATDSR